MSRRCSAGSVAEPSNRQGRERFPDNHIEVWASKEEWERFRTERVEPALDKVFAAAGFADRPPRPPMQEMDLVDVRVGG